MLFFMLSLFATGDITIRYKDDPRNIFNYIFEIKIENLLLDNRLSNIKWELKIFTNENNSLIVDKDYDDAAKDGIKLEHCDNVPLKGYRYYYSNPKHMCISKALLDNAKTLIIVFKVLCFISESFISIIPIKTLTENYDNKFTIPAFPLKRRWDDNYKYDKLVKYDEHNCLNYIYKILGYHHDY